jgi:drug/metabolite transporter (DMT)-like permease
VALTIISILSGQSRPPSKSGSWLSAGLLFGYAAAFSFAYVVLSVGTGALILFAAVQLTMLIAAVWSGESIGISQWAGLTAAFAGLIVLLIPGLSAPPFWASVLMAIAGISWGFYSLRGRGSENPLADTTANFVRSVPFAFVLIIATAGSIHLTRAGITFALLSGIIASGIGYTIWYSALRGLSATQAAVVQLTVPIIASVAGVLFLAEAVTARLAISTIMILGGVALALLGNKLNPGIERS